MLLRMGEKQGRRSEHEAVRFTKVVFHPGGEDWLTNPVLKALKAPYHQLKLSSYKAPKNPLNLSLEAFKPLVKIVDFPN